MSYREEQEEGETLGRFWERMDEWEQIERNRHASFGTVPQLGTQGCEIIIMEVVDGREQVWSPSGQVQDVTRFVINLSLTKPNKGNYISLFIGGKMNRQRIIWGQWILGWGSVETDIGHPCLIPYWVLFLRLEKGTEHVVSMRDSKFHRLHLSFSLPQRLFNRW